MSNDFDATLAFLQQRGAPWNLTSIHPTIDGMVKSATFTDPDKARAWLERYAETNLYFASSPADKVTGKGGRLTRDDLTLIIGPHADLDVDKEENDLTLDERKARKLKELNDSEFPPPPTFVIDSGGGLWAQWMLDKPLEANPENIEWVESVNRWMVTRFGADTQTTDAGRLLRLPGTTNYPNEGKLARGRVVAPAKLMQSSGLLHDEWGFGRAAKGASSRSVADKECDPRLIVPVETLDDLKPYGLPEALIALIIEGHADGEDRSAKMFGACCWMTKCGVPVGVIAGVLLNDAWAIGSHVRDHKARPIEVYAMRQAIKALHKVDEERQEDIKDFEPIAEEWKADDWTPDEYEYPQEFTMPEPEDNDKWGAWFRENFEPIGEVDPATIPLMQWIVHGVLLANEVTTLAGKGGAGKSVLAYHMMVMLASASPFAWMTPRLPGCVLIISGEDDKNEVERRVVAACKELGVNRAALAGRIFIWANRSDIRMVVKQKDGTIRRTKLWHGVQWAIKNLGVVVYSIDPSTKMSSGFDQNNNDDMYVVYGHLRDVTEGYPCACLVLDHFAKGGTGGDQGATRGASAKVDASRVALTLSAMTEAEHDTLKPPLPRESYVLVSDPKQNYTKRTGSRWLEWTEHEVGNTEQRPGLRWRDFASTEAVLDPQQWPHRIAFLQMVEDGCVAKAVAQPWSVSTKGPKDVRLDNAVASVFNVTMPTAQRWIEAFEKEGAIRQAEWLNASRRPIQVWERVAEYQTEEEAT
jgi:hypothetical protein